jgi:hypothetical protein
MWPLMGVGLEVRLQVRRLQDRLRSRSERDKSKNNISSESTATSLIRRCLKPCKSGAQTGDEKFRICDVVVE